MKERPSPKKGSPSAESKRHFAGTDNPRHLRIINALQVRPRPREDVDRISGASNGPELVAELRRRGLDIPCNRTPCIDKDGRRHQGNRGPSAPGRRLPGLSHAGFWGLARGGYG
jgi:hypothetical protein